MHPKDNPCKASVREWDRTLQVGKSMHNCVVEMGLMTTAKIISTVKLKALEDKFKPISAIVNEGGGLSNIILFLFRLNFWQLEITVTDQNCHLIMLPLINLIIIIKQTQQFFNGKIKMLLVRKIYVLFKKLLWLWILLFLSIISCWQNWLKPCVQSYPNANTLQELPTGNVKNSTLSIQEISTLNWWMNVSPLVWSLLT